MIVLDTNLVAEPLRQNPDPAIRAWLDRQDEFHLYVTAITAAELLAGVAQLPLGRRRSGLENRILGILDDFGEGRILPFNLAASHTYAVLRARARGAGFVISPLDAQIAAIAASRGFSVATRDTAPFIAAGVAVIDPWHSASV